MNSATDRLLASAPHSYKLRVRHKLEWTASKHHYQCPPEGDWIGWVIQAGRGSGKTRTGAEDAAEFAVENRNIRYAVVAPTGGDVRDICFEGESGILFVLRRMGLVEGVDYSWNKSLNQIKIFETGSQIKGYTAKEPNRLRGPQHHRAWFEELAAWHDAHLGDALNTTYNNAMLGLRLGADPRYIVTTTPKPVKLVRELAERSDVVVTRGSSYDNLPNLAPKYREIIQKYQGTRIGRQEVFGELLEDIEGALWIQAMIDDFRWQVEWGPPRLSRVYVGVDPSGGSSESAGETGIVAAGRVRGKCPCGGTVGPPAHYVVVADCSLRGTAMRRARAIVNCFDHTEADKVVGERNYGGDMVEALVEQASESDDRVPYENVNATRGKQVRAEPIATAYEQGRVHHLHEFVKLEEQLTTWEPDSGWSPDRLDALVWAITKLQARRGRKVRTGGTDSRLP